MKVSYPTFAWYWDNDREGLMRKFVDTDTRTAIEHNGIKLEEVYDFENFYNCVVVKLRDGRNVLCNKEV